MQVRPEERPSTASQQPTQVREPGTDAPGDFGVPTGNPAGTLNFISTTTVFGTPIDVTLSELAIEAFFPADEQTAQALRQMAA